MSLAVFSVFYLSVSEAPVQAPKPQKYDSYNPETYKTDEQKKEEVSTNEPRHEISNNVVCATSKGSDQPVFMHSLIRLLLVA